MKNYKLSLIFNIIIFVLVTLGTVFMFSGIRFMGDDMILSVSGFEFLKFFTVDSNILMGISALIFAYYDYLVLRKKKKEIPNNIYLLKHIATVSVTLTFLITIVVLAPFSEYSFFAFYKNSNLFFHLIVPILSIITYLLFEKNSKLNKKVILLGMIPMIIYSIFYITNYLLNYKGVDKINYDWYNFMNDSIIISIITIGIMFLLTYSISLVLFYLNRKVYSVK